MTTDTVLRVALIEAVDFIGSLLECKPDEAVDLLSSAGENVEDRLTTALKHGSDDYAVLSTESEHPELHGSDDVCGS